MRRVQQNEQIVYGGWHAGELENIRSGGVHGLEPGDDLLGRRRGVKIVVGGQDGHACLVRAVDDLPHCRFVAECFDVDRADLSRSGDGQEQVPISGGLDRLSSFVRGAESRQDGQIGEARKRFEG